MKEPWGIFRKGYSGKKETVAKTEPQRPNNAVSSGSSLPGEDSGGMSTSGPNGEPTVSGGKGSEKTLNGKGLGEKIAEAEAETDTSPTDGQKEAGNYRKGHVQVGTFDITIEQPRGSVRSGVDAEGNRWETEMKNTYGYIRGTEGVDGDHIDVFLSDDIDGWDGRRVFVVDQYNTDGSFDEHKVMLGFNGEEEAADAYFANYERGWGEKHHTVVSSVNLEDFERWIGSSHRKTKPFADYKSVKAEAARQERLSEKEAKYAEMDEGVEAASAVELTEEDGGDAASEPVAPYSVESSNFASSYETKEGKAIGYTSENPEAYEVSNAKDRAANSGAGEADVQRQGDNLLSGRNSGLNADEGEFCLVERVFTENGSFNFTSGERIESADDVAFIFSALEDAAKEHAFVVYVKDGHPTVVELGMGTFTATMVDIPTASLAYNRIRPDQVYFVHNHPSGNLKCSMQDVQMLKNIEDMCDVPVSGVIINLKTGKYGTFDTSNNNGVGNKRVPDTESRLAVHTLDRQIFAPDYDPMAQPLVRSALDVASFLNSHRMGDRAKVSFLILSRAGRIVGNIHTPFTEIASNTKEVARYMSERIIQFGGESAILYGDFPMASSNGRDYRQLKELLTQVGGNTLLDVVRVEGNHTTSARDEGMLYEQDSEYGSSQVGEEDARLQFAERYGEGYDALSEEQKSNVADYFEIQDELDAAYPIEIPATVPVVEAAHHPFNTQQKTSALKKEVESYAVAHGIIGTMSNEETNGKGEIRISKQSVDKFVDDSAADKSVGRDVHLSVLPVIRDVIRESFEGEVHPDVQKDAWGNRVLGNKVNKDVVMHRLFGAVNIDGTNYTVKITLKELRNRGERKAYSYEVTNIELPSGKTQRGRETRLPRPDNSIEAQGHVKDNSTAPLGTAKLLEGVEKSYEKGKKLLDESGKAEEEDGDVLLRKTGYDDETQIGTTGDKRTFDERQKQALEENGIVMPGLNEAEVTIVKAEPHSFNTRQKATDLKKEVRAYADTHGITGTMSNEETNGKGVIHISGSSIGKFVDNSATNKSVDVDTHLSVLLVICDVIRESVLAETHPDFEKGEDGNRTSTSKINEDGLIHRLYGAIVLDGKIYRVKTTLKENRTSETGGSKAYSYEVTEIELLPGQYEAPTHAATSRNENNSKGVERSDEILRLPTAKLLEGVEKSYEKGKKLLEESEKPTESGTSVAEMAARVGELSEKLHTPVRIIGEEEAARLPSRRQRRAKGWWSRRDNSVVVVLPNHIDVSDVENTVLHEVVGHYGLRAFIGEKEMPRFLDEIYGHATDPIKKEIDERAEKMRRQYISEKGGGALGEAHYVAEKKADEFRRDATEEYLADEAGRIGDRGFEKMASEERTFWGKVMETVQRFLDKFLKGLGIPKSVRLTKKHLHYILYRSWKARREAGVLDEAEDIAMRRRTRYDGRNPSWAETCDALTSVSKEKSPNEDAVAQTDSPSRAEAPGYVHPQSEKSAAKIAKVSDNLKSLSENIPDTGIGDAEIVYELSKALGINSATSDKSSYSLINVGNSTPTTIRVSNHSANPVNFGRTDNNVGIVIKTSSNRFKGVDGRDYVEFMYYGDKVRGNATLQRAIIDGLRHYVETGSFGKMPEADRLNTSGAYRSAVEGIEGGMMFRDGRSFTPRDTKTARDAYNRMVSSGGYQFKEAVQDSMLGLKKLYEAVLPGYRIEDVAGYENAYLFENRMSSMNAGEQHEYFVRYMKPLLTEIGRICGSSKSERRLLTDYLMAKHGLERNEYMRNEAASNGEATDRDFAGLTGLTGEADWQAAEAAAQTMVDDYEADHETLALWTAINAATKATLEKVRLSGMISEETWEKIRDMYEYYVPLRGWDQTTSDEVYGYLTSRNGPLNGSIMKKAHGRESMADDPIATIAMMADDAIRQGNRNCMKQRFLNFVLNHPSDAVSVHDLWLEYDAAHDEWKPVFADIEPTDTAEEVARKVDAFEADMERLSAAEPDRYKRGREAHSIPYKVVKGNLKEHQVLIKRNGRTFVATINGNPRAAQAINGLTNPDVETDGVVGNLLKGAQWVNRQLSAFYTTRNPDFVASNFFRDMLYSNCMTWVKESPRYALAFHKNFGRANPATLRWLVGKWEKGTLNRGNRLEEMFYQFMKNGGETGYTNVKDIEGYKRTVAKELKRQGSVGRRAWSALGMQLDLLNRSAENCARFAAFVTSREFGRSIDRAIYDAKEVSVNFNKKGSGGKMVNAVGQTKLGKLGAYIGGGGRLAYVFWNAGIQGLTNAGRAAKRHPVKAVAGAGALFALGCVIPLLAQSMGGDGDDDDKNAYYNLPEYVRRSNICIRAGEQWISIPLPIEYRAVYGLGELACGVISGNERYGDEELAYQIGAQVSQIMPLDMLEGGGGISPFIPSIAKPFTEAYIMNRGWTGLPVYKDNAFNKNMPEWTKAYASADRHLVDFAKWLNETSGGDDFKKGAIDINPAKIEYLLNGTFGGLFTFPEKIKKTGETAFGDRDFEWRNIPIANRLVKSGDERTAYRKLTNEYFKYYEEFEETGRLMRKYQNAADNGVLEYAEKVKFLETSPEYGRWEVFDFFKPDMDGYREDIKAETDAATKAQLEAEYHALMRELVNALHDPEKFWEGRKAQ